MCGGRGGGVGGRRGGGVGTHIRTRTHHQYYVTGPEGLSVKRQHERTQTGCGAVTVPHSRPPGGGQRSGGGGGEYGGGVDNIHRSRYGGIWC